MVLQAHPGISLAILFGSLATGTAGPGSDLDLAVYNYETIDWAIVHAIARPHCQLPTDFLTANFPLFDFLLLNFDLSLVTRHYSPDPDSRLFFPA